MKKEINKEKLEQEFKLFLDKHNLEVINNFYGKGVVIKKSERENKYYSGYVQTLLFESSFDKIQGELNGKPYFLKFIKSLLNKKETQTLALKLCIDKEPSIKEYNYSNYVTTVIDILLEYKDIYLQFITRDKFLNNNLDKIESLVESVDSQINKELIIDKALTVSTFKILKNQSTIYNLIKKSILNKKKYEYSFPKISNINVNDSFIVEIKKDERLKIKFDILKINALFIQKAYGENEIYNHFKNVENVIKENYLNELNINNISLSYYNAEHKIEFYVYGNHLNEYKFNNFFNILITKKLLNNINSVNEMNQLVKETIIEANYNNLNNSLTSEKKNIKRSKM